jgi:hypothetical protein
MTTKAPWLRGSERCTGMGRALYMERKRESEEWVQGQEREHAQIQAMH